jgi:lipopolysaccharide biosynthesis glycosyltransferase
MFTNFDNLEREKCLESHRQQEPIVVVCAADDKYAMPLGVMIRSVLANLKGNRQINLFIIDGGICNHNKKKIVKSLNSKQCEVIFLSKPDFLIKDIKEADQYCVNKGIENKTHLSVAAYYRLLIAELLPQQFEKAIYLDCDLILQEDLEKLWQIDLEENYLLAVPDMWIDSISAHNGLLNYQELGLDANLKYFNSGVIVINLKKWRTERIFAKAVEYFKKNKIYVRFHDQDILNALFAGKWGEIDPRWNVTPGIYEYPSWEVSPFAENVYNNLLNEPFIIHFAAEKKPWNSKDVLLKEHFFHYVDLTAWAGWRFTFLRQIWLELVGNIKYKANKALFLIRNRNAIYAGSK